MAKIFISFLGTNPYLHCKYKLDEENISEPVRYIQEALAQIVCKDWKKEDKILIFATNGEQGSIKKNWENGEVNKFDEFGKKFEKEPTGLKDRLEKLNLSSQIDMIPIPDGMKDGEIWKIIEEINNQIEIEDELYFDITHSFRYIPMIIPPLISFLKITKNIILKTIYYGAFETLGFPKDITSVELEKREAPIRELKELYKMIEWAEATTAFLKFGSGKDLIEQLDNIKSMPKKVNNSMLALKRNIEKVDNALKYNNISEFKIKDNIKIGKKIKLKEFPNLFALKELSPKIEGYLNQWDREDDIKNGILATKWCLENDRFAQALTFYQETLITYFISLLEMGDNKSYRGLINFIIKVKIGEKNKNEFSNNAMKEEYNQNIDKWLNFLDKIDNESLKYFVKISDWRNIINHAKKSNRKNMIKEFPNILEHIEKHILNQR